MPTSRMTAMSSVFLNGKSAVANRIIRRALRTAAWLGALRAITARDFYR
jgi:hypothetical protein